MNANKRFLTGLGFALTLAASSVRADYELFWFTIDGGGAHAVTGGAFELAATAGQPDAGVAAAGAFELSSGFWPGMTRSGQECTGGERVAKASCKDRGGVNQLKVSLAGGREGDSFSVTLTDGSTKTGTINSHGKGKATFKNRPPGDSGTATANWGCGATDQGTYSCP